MKTDATNASKRQRKSQLRDVAATAKCATLQQLLDTFFEHLDVKPITALGYQATRKALLEYFGPKTRVCCKPISGGHG
jgi:hypothetical protein